jgi:exosortase H (IPTLxxWG-CTERM-specific)
MRAKPGRESTHALPPRPRNPRSPRAAEPLPPRGGERFGRRPVLRFVALFALFMIAFYALTLMPWFTRGVFPHYLHLNARISGAILNVLGEDARVAQTSIITPRFALGIERGCDAIEPAALFAAAVVAFPVPLRRKAPGLAVGISLLLLINLVRIVSLYYAGVYYPSAFETLHAEVWQPLFILIAVLFWVVWALRATGRAPRP